jgi:hypothetical protein
VEANFSHQAPTTTLALEGLGCDSSCEIFLDADSFEMRKFTFTTLFVATEGQY